MPDIEELEAPESESEEDNEDLVHCRQFDVFAAVRIKSLCVSQAAEDGKCEGRRKPFKQLTVHQQATLMGLKAAGKNFTTIGEIMEIDRRTVARNFKKIMKRQLYGRKEGSGRKRKTTDKEDKRIVREVKKNRYSTAKDIAKALPELGVSEWTIRRRIVEKSDFASKWQSKKPFISPANRIKRVQWARDHLTWTFDDWRKVLWSDESPFVLRFNQRKRVWRTDAERHSKWCTKATVKHDDKINVWGCFAAHGVGRMYLVEGILRKEQYMKIVEEYFYPSAIDLFGEQECIFQEDNDPKHTAVCVKQW